jgi:hypothetical protein
METERRRGINPDMLIMTDACNDSGWLGNAEFKARVTRNRAQTVRYLAVIRHLRRTLQAMNVIPRKHQSNKQFFKSCALRSSAVLIRSRAAILWQACNHSASHFRPRASPTSRPLLALCLTLRRAILSGSASFCAHSSSSLFARAVLRRCTWVDTVVAAEVVDLS